MLPALLILAAAPPGLAQDFDSSFRQPHFYLGADVGESTIRDNFLGFEQHGIGFDLRASAATSGRSSRFPQTARRLRGRLPGVPR